MRREAILPDQIYHIYNRGNNHQKIFVQKADYYLFLLKIKKYFAIETAEVLSYCMMPNHFHLLIYNHCENFGSKIMMPLITSFTKTMNLKYSREGHLFQGAYNAKLIDSDESLMQVSRYIHLNPVKAKLVERLEDWEFSSYLDYIGSRNDAIVRLEYVMELFSKTKEYREFVESECEITFDIKKYVFDN